MTIEHRETEMAEIDRPDAGEPAAGERAETAEVAEPETEAMPVAAAAAVEDEDTIDADAEQAEEESAADEDDDEEEDDDADEGGDADPDEDHEAEDEADAAASASTDGRADDMEASDFDNLRLVEALLFASAEPLAPAQIARFLPDDCKLDPLLADLQALYANRGVNVVKRGGRWAFRTADDLAPRMELENKVVRKLSRVALETLAVIAYHQPVTRAEIEEIRGVALSKGTLDALLEIGWIRPKGRRKTPGRPVTWGTSDAFLDQFNLDSLDALPGVEELKAAGLLDTRPALTALSDRGLLPAAGEVAPEARDDDEDDESDSDLAEGSERELLEETFGENLLPHEVDLAAAGGADEDADEDAGEAAGEEPGGAARRAPDEAENEMFGGADEADEAPDEADEDDEDAEDEDAGELEDELDDDLDDGDLDDDEDAGDDDEDAGADDDLRQRRRHSAGHG